MVISQIAGLATAFGTGELSGAGFGPNYTILMKLGYEFFAPRILEEMEKNPNVFFQDTLWFQKFQKQIKLYSDTVMKETLDTLLSIPQVTIDAIQKKFGPGGDSGNILSENLLGNIEGTLRIVEGIAEAFKNLNFNFNIGIPQAFGEDPPVFSPPSPPPSPPPQHELPGQGSGSPQGPSVPEGGITPPIVPNIAPDTRLADYKEKWRLHLKDALTLIANKVNDITANYNPSQRRRTQSSNLQLSGYITGSNQLSASFGTILLRIQDSINNTSRRNFQHGLLDDILEQYEFLQIKLARHLKTYTL